MKLKVTALLTAVLLLTASLITWDSVARTRSASAMAAAANKFLHSLTAEQKAKANFQFNDEQRFDWHFIPRDRQGLPLKEMNEAQRKIALDFLRAGLSARGYWKATTIIALENVLREIEGPNRRWPRDPQLYYFSVFGTPGTKQAWGWRVEGHHMSLNFTVNGNSLVATSPAFFGTNPREVRADLPQKGLRVLSEEEDAARELVHSLNEQQRAKAVYDAKAPGDILTMASKEAARQDNSGISADTLNQEQFSRLRKLVEIYCNNVPDDLAAERKAKFQQAQRNEIYFAWAGGTEKNQPCYYRVQTPAFLIEYDDTQNDANHVHSVWRDFRGDFGRDLLAEHYLKTPHQNALFKTGAAAAETGR